MCTDWQPLSDGKESNADARQSTLAITSLTQVSEELLPFLGERPITVSPQGTARLYELSEHRLTPFKSEIEISPVSIVMCRQVTSRSEESCHGDNNTES